MFRSGKNSRSARPPSGRAGGLRFLRAVVIGASLLLVAGFFGASAGEEEELKLLGDRCDELRWAGKTSEGLALAQTLVALTSERFTGVAAELAEALHWLALFRE